MHNWKYHNHWYILIKLASLEHLQEFPKHYPNPWFLARLKKTYLQQFLIPPPNLLALGNSPLRAYLCTDSHTRVSSVRYFPGVGAVCQHWHRPHDGMHGTCLDAGEGLLCATWASAKRPSTPRRTCASAAIANASTPGTGPAADQLGCPSGWLPPAGGWPQSAELCRSAVAT